MFSENVGFILDADMGSSLGPGDGPQFCSIAPFPPPPSFARCFIVIFQRLELMILIRKIPR